MAARKIRISETSCGRSASVRRTPFAIPEAKPQIAVRETAARKKRNTEGRFVTRPILLRCAVKS